MAKEKTDNSKYESAYGGGFITSGQFIAELMCGRLAKKNKKELPNKFWNMPAHKRSFMQNILAANALLKMYHPKAIIAAIRKAPNLYSLRAPWLDDLIKQEQEQLEAFEEKVETQPTTPLPADISITEKPRESFAIKKSPLDKLRELDG